MKCLVVEPSPTMTRVLRNILRGAGADECLCVAGADAAIDLLEKRKSPELDLVVTERDLSGQSGLELLAVLRTREGLEEVPAIVVSSRNSRRDVLEAIQAGADAYVLKPLDQEALLSRATAVLEARRAVGAGKGEDATGDGSAEIPEGPPAVKPAADAAAEDDVVGSAEGAAPDAGTADDVGDPAPEADPEDESRRAA